MLGGPRLDAAALGNNLAVSYGVQPTLFYFSGGNFSPSFIEM